MSLIESLAMQIPSKKPDDGHTTAGAVTLRDDDDAITEPPEDPPATKVFDPMPKPGPEVDCVRGALKQFDATWTDAKVILGSATTAYGYPVKSLELSISDDRKLDVIVAEVDAEMQSK